MSPALTILSFVYLCAVCAFVCAAVREDEPRRIARRAASTLGLLVLGVGLFWGAILLIQLLA